MVHLSKVTHEPHQNKERRNRRDSDVSPEYGNVYAMRYATEELPSHVLNQKGMPADVAYRMITDELSLDGTPLLK